MTAAEALQQHQQICDELYALAQEENRYLQQHQSTPEAPLLERKSALLGRLEEALEALRAAEPGSPRDPARRAALDKARSRILQILQLDRENEQLLLRYSLRRGPAAAPDSQGAPAGLLRKIYAQHLPDEPR